MKLAPHHQKLLAEAAPLYKGMDASHDFSHIQSVIKNCLKIAHDLKGGNVDMDLLVPAAIFHDVVTLPKDTPDRHRASQLAADKASAILKKLRYSSNAIKKIEKIIMEHSFSAAHAPSSLESQILQDADRLESLGAIGVMRVFAVCGRLGRPFFHEGDPFAHHRDLEDDKFALDHFETKIFQLYNMLNTPPARALARPRVAFMNSFIDQLKEEILD